MGRTVAVWPSFAAGYSRASADASAVTLACACGTVTPGLSRATPWSSGLLRSATAARISVARSCSAIANGNQRSGPTRPFTPMNPGWTNHLNLGFGWAAA